MGVWTGENFFNEDWHFIAFDVYMNAISGEYNTYDWTSISLDLSQYQETCKYFTICTWGVDANKNIGNPNVAYGSVSSSSRSLSPVNPSLKKAMISHEQMQKIRNNTVVYMINE